MFWRKKTHLFCIPDFHISILVQTFYYSIWVKLPANKLCNLFSFKNIILWRVIVAFYGLRKTQPNRRMLPNRQHTWLDCRRETNSSICECEIRSTIFLLSLISSTIIWATFSPIPPYRREQQIHYNFTSIAILLVWFGLLLWVIPSLADFHIHKYTRVISYQTNTHLHLVTYQGVHSS